MNPCTYNGYNYQKTWEPFAELDLWLCCVFRNARHKPELDKVIAYGVPDFMFVRPNYHPYGGSRLCFMTQKPEP